jgi:hypothetical protein
VLVSRSSGAEPIFYATAWPHGWARSDDRSRRWRISWAHRNIDTTAFYVKVAVPQLADVALPFPGGAP